MLCFLNYNFGLLMLPLPLPQPLAPLPLPLTAAGKLLAFILSCLTVIFNSNL